MIFSLSVFLVLYIVPYRLLICWTIIRSVLFVQLYIILAEVRAITCSLYLTKNHRTYIISYIISLIIIM